MEVNYPSKAIHISPFDRSNHITQNFICKRHPIFGTYINKTVDRDITNKQCMAYIVASDDSEVIAYYTLSTASITKSDMAGHLSKNQLKKFTSSAVPCILIGRIVVHSIYEGQKIGSQLLWDALKRAFTYSGTIGASAVIVDPIDLVAKNWYEKYGFIPLDSGKMFLPMRTLGFLMAK